MSKVSENGGIRRKLAWLAFILALLIPVWFIAAALGTKHGLWGWQFGLGKMTLGWGPLIVMGVMGLALVTFILAWFARPRVRTAILSAIAAFICLWPFFGILNLKTVSEALPPIHDVQTDWTDPVRFSDALMAERAKTEGVNPVLDDPKIPEYAKGRWPGMQNRRVAEVQAEKYEPLQTKIYKLPPDKLFIAAYLTMNEMGLEIVTEDEDALRLEGTFTSRWFGFKDDVAVRIRSKGRRGSSLDVRSVSRVGLSDLGANMERVHTFLERLDTRVKQLESNETK